MIKILMMTTAITTKITLYHNDNDVSEDNCYEDDENDDDKRISFSLVNDKDNVSNGLVKVVGFQSEADEIQQIFTFH